MPRGDNPNSRANLQPVRSKEEAREKGKKGGIASGETRKTLGSFRAAYKRTMTDEDLDLILAKVRDMAKRGNLGALDRLLQISGENKDDHVDDIDQVKAFLDYLRDGSE